MINNLNKEAYGDRPHLTTITVSSSHYKQLIYLQFHKNKLIAGNYKISNKNKHTDRQTHRQTDRQRHRQTDRHA